jgi:hypothetical protein
VAVTESLPNAGYWQLLIASAVVIGGIGGILEGLALRYGPPILALFILAVASVPGLWLPLLTLGRWFSQQQDDLVDTGLLTGALAGWLMFMLVIGTVGAAVAAVGHPREPRR